MSAHNAPAPSRNELIAMATRPAPKTAWSAAIFATVIGVIAFAAALFLNADRAWRAHAESAMRAVKKCDPLKVPAQYMPYFDQWKIETIHFDPRETQG